MTTAQEIKTCAEKGRPSPTENEIKAAPQIEKLLIQLRNDGRKLGTILNYRKTFNRLLRVNADLFDPESAKAALAKLPHGSNTKKCMAAVLDVWFDFNNIKWKPPKYSDEHEAPFIPSEALLDLLIAALGRKMSCFCLLLKETGARAGEIAELELKSLDFEQRKVRINAEKGSNSRIRPLSPKAIEMIKGLPKNRNEERKDKLFANAGDMRSCFFTQRRRVASKLANPDVLKIHFHTFRHWKATTEQHKTKDIFHVQRVLGHKSVKSTEKYIHIAEEMYEGETVDEFDTKVADTADEAAKLMEVGYEYHVEIEGHKLFRRKRKPYNGLF